MKKLRYFALVLVLLVIFCTVVPIIDEGFPNIEKGAFGFSDVASVRCEGTTKKPFVLDVNTATVGELSAIDGIGDKKAQAIVDYRNAHGSFKSIDELTNVKGIGKATLNKIRNNLVITER